MARPQKNALPTPPVENAGDPDKPLTMDLQEPGPAAQEPAQKPVAEAVGVPSAEPAPARLTMPFRPQVRPSVAVLTVCDDGKADGEVIRIRSPRFVIGRTDGDLRIPIDGRISARHVEITLQSVGHGHHRWVVTDLQSTHGLFVRVSRTLLADKAEFLVGSGRYLFEEAQHPGGESTEHLPGEERFAQTDNWSEPATPFRPPALTELLGRDIGNRMLLDKPEYWIGSDPDCAICRPSDPYCEPRHVHIARNAKGKWFAEHNKTTNGLWLRVAQITVDSPVEFQIGEQRFRLRIS